MGTNGTNGHDPGIKPPHWGDVNLGGSEPAKPKKRGLFGCLGVFLALISVPAAAVLAVAGAVADAAGWLG